jgi:protein TonB
MKSILVFSVLSALSISAPIAGFAAAKPEPQEQAPASPQRIRVGGNVQAANLITKVNPVYPADMKEQRLEGTVVLQAVISKEGVPDSLNSENAGTNRSFVDAAIDAVKQWRYKPTLLNGQPVEVITTITVNFTLSQ